MSRTRVHNMNISLDGYAAPVPTPKPPTSSIVGSGPAGRSRPPNAIGYAFTCC